MTRAMHDSAAGLLVLLTGQRAGSNYFLSMLQGSAELVVLSEVFNPRAVYGLSTKPRIAAELEARLGGAEGVHRAFRLYPEAALLELRRVIGPGKQVLIKICPAQVHGNALRRIISAQADGAILLTRRRLEQYVSFVKALQTRQWHTVATTELSPRVGVDPFLSWAADIDRWLAGVARICRDAGIALAHVDYDRHLSLPDPEHVAEHLERQLAGLALPPCATGRKQQSFFHRQDGASDCFGRFANGAEMRADLSTLGLLDYALSSQADDGIARVLDGSSSASPQVGSGSS